MKIGTRFDISTRYLNGGFGALLDGGAVAGSMYVLVCTSGLIVSRVTT